MKVAPEAASWRVNRSTKRMPSTRMSSDGRYKRRMRLLMVVVVFVWRTDDAQTATAAAVDGCANQLARRGEVRCCRDASGRHNSSTSRTQMSRVVDKLRRTQLHSTANCRATRDLSAKPLPVSAAFHLTPLISSSLSHRREPLVAESRPTAGVCGYNVYIRQELQRFLLLSSSSHQAPVMVAWQWLRQWLCVLHRHQCVPLGFLDYWECACNFSVSIIFSLIKT